MSGISFMGSYSGIDRSTIDQLMQVERLPLNQYTTRKTSITEQQNAWKDVNTRLNSLFEKIKALQSSDVFTSNKATSTNEDILGVSASKDALAGTYKINVEQLATSTSIVGAQINLLDDNGKIKEGGSFTIGGTELELLEKYIVDDLGLSKTPEGKYLDSEGQEVDLDVLKETEEFKDYLNARKVTLAEGDSLKDIAENINSKSKDTGVSASIIDNRLVLTNDETGNKKILLSDSDVDNGILKGLGLDNISVDNYNKDGDLINVQEVKGSTGKQAILDINGVDITNNSNNVSGVIDGLTINLKKVTEGVTTVTVGADTEKASKAIKDFVDQYNSTMQFIEDKLAAGNPESPGSRGTLAGDGSLMRLQSSLRNLVTSRVSGNEGEFTDISQLGVTTVDRYGKLQFDASKLSDAIKENPDTVAAFFNIKDGDKDIGFVSRLNTQIDSFISKENGIIKTKNESYDKTLKDINRRIEDFEARMVKKEEQLVKTFTALDVAMMQAESQMTWLQGQVDAMNGIKR